MYDQNLVGLAPKEGTSIYICNIAPNLIQSFLSGIRMCLVVGPIHH